MHCFECSSIGHVQLSCPFRTEAENEDDMSNILDEGTENTVRKETLSGDVELLNNENLIEDSKTSARGRCY